MRSRILLLLTLLAMLSLSNTATAQWQQTSGPSGGQVSSFVKTPTGWLAVIGQGLYKYQQNRWTEVAPQWYGQLFQTSNVILAAHVNMAKVSSNNGDTWSDTKLPSDFIMVHGDQFISKSIDSLFRSTDGVNWEFYALLPQESVTLVEHKGKLYTQAGFNGMKRSTDLGVTWTPVGTEPPFSIAMEWFSSEDALFALPYPSGIFRTTDEGVTWQDMHLNLDEGTVFEGVAANHSDVFVSDWLTTYQLKNDQWVEVPIAQIHDATTIDGKIYMATNSGLVEYANGKFNAMTEGVYSPNVSALGSVGSTIFARTNNGLYRSQDGGTDWELNSTRFATHMATAQGSIVTLGTGVMRSTDQGDTWQNLDEVLEEFLVSPTDLIASGDDLYLTSALVSAGEHGSQTQWTTGGIYRSTDGGAIWRDVSGNLPENLWTKVPVYSVAAANGKLVIYTADGMFAANEGSTNWHRVTPPPVKYALEVNSNGDKFIMLADSTWYTSLDGDVWTELSASASADFMRNYESLVSFSSIRGIPYITTSRYERIDSTNWRTLYRNFKLENNAWIDITSTLPANTVTAPMIEHQGSLYAGTSSLGVWKMGLPASVGGLNEKTLLQLYPNPTVDFVMLPFTPKTVSVFNALGQNVTAQTRLDAASLDVRLLATGVYQLSIDGKSASFVKH
jgi:hypothetical protein